MANLTLPRYISGVLACIVCVFIFMTMDVGLTAGIVVLVLIVLGILSVAAYYFLFRHYCNRKPENASLLEAGTQPREELCVVAADQHTLSTIAEEVREATAGIPQAYPVREHRVSNRRDVADLPLYRRSVCCVRNAERNISFNKHGEPEPDADLGFRAFHKMEESTGRSGVILVLFDHGQSQGISDLYSMEGINPSQRLLDAAKGPPCRFLTVSRKLNIEQKGFISRWAKP
ncbi:uncharacterized protein LOC118429875 isoform X2 [Branchiostoma floridae]|uniref:Uncharacterized protein LOC118429875 isoform X2 n=1 Tax=Branchiostoma floridae TaxID=7739 RepID=A0A9J7NA47_BRAFL|nr:uncharacterized protein LOC118429875 isoform X2 [Branchiostoma floridae]